MSKSHDQVTPRTFFLNEQHELPHDEKRSGGQLPKFANIDWAAKSQTLNQTLSAAAQKLDRSRDPLRKERYFLLAAPASVEKSSTDKKKAPAGTFVEQTDFSKTQTRVFGRLGLDLIEVADDGRAVVHAKAERLEQLKLWSSSLDQLGAREQARWATLDSFDTIPPDLRIDSQWWQSLKKKSPIDALVELQPLLTRSEVERVMRAIADLLLDKQHEKLTATGSDLSGRFWLRGSISPESLREIASDFFSVQSLHPPLYSMAAAINHPRSAARASQTPPTAIEASTLPSVGVLDSGVPEGHALLAPFRRGTVVGPTSIGRAVGDHGSKVASRIVFGEQDFSGGVKTVAGSCRFLDIQVSMGHGQYDDKGILAALETAIRAHPDVRVFNLSLADRQPVASYSQVEKRERLRLLQDLDCLVFETDVLVVIAAGNTEAGVVPSPAYPDHVEVPDWRLGVWASGFNTLVCGSHVGRLGIGGLAQLGWPSPFTRIGPGVAGAPIPGYSAPGGNTNAVHQFVPGLGEWVCTAEGRWEDHSGTSFAAPLLAREAAFGLQSLQHYCQQGSKPFGVTLKAFLALVADAPDVPVQVQPLAEHTLGRGTTSAARLRAPDAASAVMLWQGTIDGPTDEISVQLPIPSDWLNEAQKPVLRLVACYDPPVNEAANGLWASRRVSMRLRRGPDEKAERGGRGNHASYPLLERSYDLQKTVGQATIDADIWLLELAYDEIADYRAGTDFTPQQRVAFAAELRDIGENPASPQEAMQALPLTVTMQRLSVPPVVVRAPIVLKAGL